jgi:Tol biopolymer transport system component
VFTPAGGVFEGLLSGDERYIAYRAGAIPGDLYYVRRDSLDAPRTIAATRFDERAPALAPGDGFLAYVSNETGRDEVYVKGFPGGATRWMVSSGGGSEPRWRRDGRELFYRNGDTLFAVPVSGGAEFVAGPRATLVIGNYITNGRHATYDVHPDGNRFVFISGPQEGTGEVILVQNFRMP